ncbi:ricin B lectin domain-containing protein [Mortierella sp. GBAus27b]|nr:hypothetical protein BGX31_010101 [Mortierella sp. GBA43]KAI8348325.1 ricin B lectin domain-containing protein [Mortierella sp. GBAus27b]
MTKGYPSGQFFIKLRYEDLVLDVQGGSTEANAAIIVWPKKATDNDNQKWTHEGGKIKNVKTGFVLHALNKQQNAEFVQADSSQRYNYDDHTISLAGGDDEGDEDLVLGVKNKEQGTRLYLVDRDDDDHKQQWVFEQ